MKEALVVVLTRWTMRVVLAAGTTGAVFYLARALQMQQGGPIAGWLVVSSMLVIASALILALLITGICVLSNAAAAIVSKWNQP